MDGSEAGTGLRSTMTKLAPAAQKLGFEIVRDAENNLDLIATLGEPGEQARPLRRRCRPGRHGPGGRLGGDEPVQALQLLRKALGELRPEADATAAAARNGEASAELRRGYNPEAPETARGW